MRLDVFKGFALQTMLMDWKSLQFKRMHRGAGAFALTLNNFDDSDYLAEDNIIIMNTDAYIIESVHRYKNSYGEATLEIAGRHINSLLERRIVQSVTINTTDTIETQLYKLITDNIISPSLSARKVEHFYNAASKGTAMKAASSYTLEKLSLLEAVNRICGYSDLGYRITYQPEQQRYEFEVYQGRDLSDAVFFGEDYANVSEGEIYLQSEEYRNAGLKGSSWQGTAEGLDRREVFLADDESLSDYARLVSVDGMILDTEQFIYRQDWDLGDIVTYEEKSLGFAAQNPILEIKETHDTRLTIEVTFGQRVPTIFDRR